MATETNPTTALHTDTRLLPAKVARPSAAVKRAAVVASRTPVPPTSTHPAVYQPWKALIDAADQRLKTEITAAVRALDAEAAEAGQLLDRAYSMAAEAAGHLESAAWTAFAKYMASADATRAGIMGPATDAYDRQITAANARYEAALADAEKTHKTLIDDATRGKTDAGTAAA